jgi:hypothetical protein
VLITAAALGVPALAQVGGPIPNPQQPTQSGSSSGGIGGIGLNLSFGGKKEPKLTGPPLDMRDRQVPDYVAGQVLFFIKGGPADSQRIARAGRVAIISSTPLPELEVTMVVARLTAPDTVDAAVLRLGRVRGTEWAQPDFEFQVLGNSRDKGAELSGIKLGPKFKVSGTIVLIDSPVDLANPALKGANIVQQGFGADLTPAAHGTAIAELLVGTGSFAGVAQGAKLISLVAFAPAGENWWRSQSSQVLVAADRAIALRPNVVNMSFGTRLDDPALALALRKLEGVGACVVAAAGNSGGGPVLFPARSPLAIAVTAVDGGKRVYGAASRGPEIDVAAWGVAMNAAVPGGRRAVSGTSFATAIVSGGLLRQSPCSAARNPAAMRSAISINAQDLGPKGRDDVFGAGLFRVR